MEAITIKYNEEIMERGRIDRWVEGEFKMRSSVLLPECENEVKAKHFKEVAEKRIIYDINMGVYGWLLEELNKIQHKISDRRGPLTIKFSIELINNLSALKSELTTCLQRI